MFFDILELSKKFIKEARDRNEYMRSYMAKRYHDKRNKLIEGLGGKCNDCGSLDGPFEIDHIDSSKKTMRAADMHSVSEEKFQEEKSNLQLFCKPCHNKKTNDAWDRSNPKPKHGTRWMYVKYKCRCEPCVKAYKKED